MLKTLDTIFHILHLTVIIINLTFWMSFRTLRIAQLTQLFTLASWIGLGLFYGFGYCFLTDWQWQIKERLGEKDLPASYIKYVFDKISGMNGNNYIIFSATWIVFLLAIIGCLIQTYRYSKRFNTK